MDCVESGLNSELFMRHCNAVSSILGKNRAVGKDLGQCAGAKLLNCSTAHARLIFGLFRDNFQD